LLIYGRFKSNVIGFNRETKRSCQAKINGLDNPLSLNAGDIVIFQLAERLIHSQLAYMFLKN